MKSKFKKNPEKIHTHESGSTITYKNGDRQTNSEAIALAFIERSTTRTNKQNRKKRTCNNRKRR